jgi:hypothetical protein
MIAPGEFERVSLTAREVCSECGEWASTEFVCVLCAWRGCGACAELHECPDELEVCN